MIPSDIAHPIPCYSLSPNWGKCPQFAAYSEEEIATMVERNAQVARQYFVDLEANICPHCQTPIAKTEQVGRCRYARPCGHRI